MPHAPASSPLNSAAGTPASSRAAWADCGDAGAVAALFLLATLPYANTLFHAFVYDDTHQIVENPYLRSWRYLPRAFDSNVWSFLGAAGVTNHYRPLMTLTYLVCYQLFGLVPFGYHLVNVVLHVAVVWLLYRLTQSLFADRRMAFLSAALFALHPVHTESVAWIAGITDLELAFFYLLTFFLFLRTGPTLANAAPPASPALWAASAGGMALALLSKEQAATLPLLATLYEHGWRPDRAQTSLWQKARRYAPLWIVTAAYLGFRVLLLGSLAPVARRELPSWPETLYSGFALIAQYVWKLLWPLELCAFWVFRKSESLLDPGALAGVGVLLLAGWLFAVLWKRHRALSLPLLWMGLTLAPVLNARWMSANVFAERYLYLPSVGFCWLLAAGWLALREACARQARGIRFALTATLLLVAGLYGARTVLRNRDWRDEETLFKQTLAISPDAHLIRGNLGVVYWNRGQHLAALREWQEAARYRPDYVLHLNNLGLAYARQKRYTEAEEHFRRAMASRPEVADPYLNLGRMHEQMGRLEQAEREYRAAVERAPLMPGPRNHLASLLQRTGRVPEAEQHFRRSVENQPSAEGHAGLAAILLPRGALDEAQVHFLRALELNPYLAPARLGLAELYAAQGRPAEAVHEYEEVLRLQPDHEAARRALRELMGPAAPVAPPR